VTRPPSPGGYGVTRAAARVVTAARVDDGLLSPPPRYRCRGPDQRRRNDSAARCDEKGNADGIVRAAMGRRIVVYDEDGDVLRAERGKKGQFRQV